MELKTVPTQNGVAPGANPFAHGEDPTEVKINLLSMEGWQRVLGMDDDSKTICAR